jgi:hypothetical protein
VYFHKANISAFEHFLGFLPVGGSAGKGSYSCLRESSQKKLNIHRGSDNVSNM